jgi:hypothetical protein
LDWDDSYPWGGGRLWIAYGPPGTGAAYHVYEDGTAQFSFTDAPVEHHTFLSATAGRIAAERDFARRFPLIAIAMQSEEWEAENNPGPPRSLPSVEEAEAALRVKIVELYKANLDPVYVGIYRFPRSGGPEEGYLGWEDNIGRVFRGTEETMGTAWRKAKGRQGRGAPVFYFVMRNNEGWISVAQFRGALPPYYTPVPDLEVLSWEAPGPMKDNPRNPRILQPWKWGAYTLLPPLPARTNPVPSPAEVQRLQAQLAEAEKDLLRAQKMPEYPLEAQRERERQIRAAQRQVTQLVSRLSGIADALRMERGREFLRASMGRGAVLTFPAGDLLTHLPEHFTATHPLVRRFAHAGLGSRVRVQQAADLLNRLLDEPEFAQMVPEREARPTDVLRPRAKSLGKKEGLRGLFLLSDQPARVQSAVEKAIRANLGGWRGTVPKILADDVFQAWAAGEAGGPVRATVDRLVVDSTLSRNELKDSMLPYANEIVKRSGYLEAFRYHDLEDKEDQEGRPRRKSEGDAGAFERAGWGGRSRGMEPVAGGGFRGELGEEVEEVRDQPEEEIHEVHDVPHPLLTKMMKGDLGERNRAALIRLHLGEQQVFPGQPRRGPTPSRKRWGTTLWAGEEGTAYQDYQRYHGAREDGCPTCVAIAQFIRGREWSLEELNTLMNWYAARWMLG